MWILKQCAAVLAAVTVAGASPSAMAQAVVPWMPLEALDSGLSDWSGPPALTIMPQRPGARAGNVWLAQTDAGLVIAGRVDGPPPRFAESAEAMPSGDHVEVWIALTENPTWPPIGWGNQFGPTTLADANACATEDIFSADSADAIAQCRVWYQDQVRYRAKLARLFVRQWQIAPAVVVETYAAPGYEAMTEDERSEASGIAPQAEPDARFQAAEGGYRFEILLPWEAMPPAESLTISSLRVMVDVFSPGPGGRYGPFSTTSRERKWGQANTFNRVTLTPPRVYHIGACNLPLEGEDFYEPITLPGYFLPPAETTQVDRFFVLENTPIGYQYQPELPSPALAWTEAFSLDLTPTMTVCGPSLAVRRGDQVQYENNYTVQSPLAARAVEDGWLVAEGPNEGMVSRLGTGACGACPTIELAMFYVPNTPAPVTRAFSEVWYTEGLEIEDDFAMRNARVSLADDFRAISAWEGAPDAEREHTIWTYTRQCYDGAAHTFALCETRENVPVPSDVPMPGGTIAD